MLGDKHNAKEMTKYRRKCQAQVLGRKPKQDKGRKKKLSL